MEEVEKTSKEKEITLEIRRPELIFLVGVLVIVFVAEIMLTLSSPIAFGDEGYHTRISQYIAENLEYPAWNPVEGTKLVSFDFSRPPLWNFLQASFYMLFGFSEVLTKTLTPFIAVMLTGVVVFFIGKILVNRTAGFLAAIIAVTLPSFVTYSVLFTTDAFLVFNIAMFILTFIMAIESEKKKYLLLSGIFAGLSFLTKTSALVVFPIILLGFLYEIYRKKSLVVQFKKYLLIAIPLILIFAAYSIRNYANYGAASCSIPILNRGSECSKTFDYTSGKTFTSPSSGGGSTADVLTMGFTNYLTFAYGNIWFVMFAFVCGIFILCYRKSMNGVIVLLMLLSFIPVMYLGSGGRSEDAARYMLGLTPLIALAAAVYFESLYGFIKKYYKMLGMVVIIFVVFFAMLNAKCFLPTDSCKALGVGYKLDIMQGVKQFSPEFFKATNFIRHNTTADALIMTVWDHQTVYNAQRNAICFDCLPDAGDIVFSNNISLSLARLKAEGITHIFIQKFSLQKESAITKYPLSFVKFMNDNPKNFVNLYETGLDADTCITQGGCDGAIVYEVRY
jgi:4-amino-4-deoxy-L-arabinose transferase-like glycosyltransferase